MILTWIQGSDVEPDALDGLGNMSKAEMLRVVVSEKLATAAQEILAVVERTLAGYEEEATGFRQEIDRQRRQLEVLLQPEIKLESTDDQQLFPICGPVLEEASGGAAGGDDLPEEEQQHKYELRLEDARSMALCYTEEQMEEDEEDEGEGPAERPVLTSTQQLDQDQDHEHLIEPEPDYEMAMRSSSPTVQSDKRSAGRSRTSESQSRVDLRIRILEDSQTNVLSTSVFKKFPVQELRCPPGLQEPDFLDLLRSSFPQLAAGKSFDVFRCDRTRRLQPLRVKTLTPEEIYRTIRSTGAGNSALYIRLKTQEEPEDTDREFHPSQTKNNAADDSPSTSDQTRQHTGVQSKRRKPGRPRASDPHNPVDLRIYILEDSQTDVLSANVFKKFPVQELRCPPGLQEPDFLDLLRSSFPQLAAGKSFDVFRCDRTRRLQPLRVKTLTPEEIYRTIRSTGAGNSALYIRLKTQEEPEDTDREFHPSQTKNNAADDSPSTSDQTRQHTGVQSKRRKPGRPRASDPHNPVDLRIYILEDSQTDVLSANVFRKFPVQELRCPPGLQEPDFLDLLRSSFPQLAAGKAFDVFRCDRTRRLQPLRVKTLTPEEIYRTIRSSGHSALYIRLKPLEKLQTRERDPPTKSKDVAPKEIPPTPDRTELNLSVKSERRKPGRRRISNTQNHVNLRVRILEDSQINVLSANVFRKSPLQELQCPCGLQEPDFLDLLRSSFPQLAAGKAFDVFRCDRTRRLQPLRAKTLTPEEIYRTIRSTGARNSAFYIRLKAQEEKVHLLQGNVDAAEDSPSSSDETSLKTRVDFLSSSSTSGQKNLETEETDDQERLEAATLRSLRSLILSESKRDEEEVNDRDNWKPVISDENQRNREPGKTSGRRQIEHSGIKTKKRRIQASPEVPTGDFDAPPSCKVCGALRGSLSMVIKHSWSHVDDLERCCGVCGKCSKSAEELRSHLQSHQKTHSCNICGKSFLSTTGLNGHIARHKGEKPYKCKICHKAFAEKSVLRNHRWVHSADKPHKCDICQKSCVSKIRLKLHRATHKDQKPFSDGMFAKPLGSLETFSQHMLIHAGRTAVREKPHVCETCSKKFHTNQGLQIHRRSHARKGPNGIYAHTGQTC